jgi:hypothetical protein
MPISEIASESKLLLRSRTDSASKITAVPNPHKSVAPGQEYQAAGDEGDC